jgi:hypothetical protein
MKDILNEVILRLNCEKGGYCRIKHKKGWLGFLEDGNTVFKPKDLHEILRKVIDKEENRPKGDKLFHLDKKFNFTIKNNKKPYRTEEALERFIVVSNDDNFFNQIPVGGRKESVDIGIKENESKFTLVELKPWRSQNSPMYAIVESLKNLIEYRIILERKIKNIQRFKEIEILVLAPLEYYQRYSLINRSGEKEEGRINTVANTLNDLGLEFNVKISCRILHIDRHRFNDTCRRLYNELRVIGQSSISVPKIYSIDSLHIDNWEILAAYN